MRMLALPVPVPQYAADALEYLAAKRGLSVEQLLAQILAAYSIQHAPWNIRVSRGSALGVDRGAQLLLHTFPVILSRRSCVFLRRRTTKDPPAVHEKRLSAGILRPCSGGV